MSRVARLVLLAAVLALPACGGGGKSSRYSRERAQDSLTRLEAPGLVIGEFPLAGNAVVDGDTVRVEGLDTSLRLLAIDTEETFKHEDNRRASEADFNKYLIDRRGDRKRPIKTGTPMGEEAKRFAKDFFAGVSTVRLERDHPKEIRGRFGRYLAYVFVKKNGKWFNYNVEAVRAGMTPYFPKYGMSRRFHQEFIEAEKEARAAKRGIWSDATQHYLDYPERLEWWAARGEFVREFERDAAGRDDYIAITNWDAVARLEQHLGKQVTVLTTVGDIVLGDRGPTRVMMSRRMFGDIPAIFWDKDVFLATGLAAYKGEFVRITGSVAEYTFKNSGKRVLQLVVDRPQAVVLSHVPGLEEVWAERKLPPAPTPRAQAQKTAPVKAAPVPEPEREDDDSKLPVFGPETEY